MAAKHISVFGMYPHRTNFEYAFCALKSVGFGDTDISAMIQDNPRSKETAVKSEPKALEETAAIADSAAVFRATLGPLAETGQLIIAGLGSFLISGPLVAMLASAGDRSVDGGFGAALLGLGITEYQAKRYLGRIKNGGVLLTVHCGDPDCVHKAKTSLRSTGAENISSIGASVAD